MSSWSPAALLWLLCRKGRVLPPCDPPVLCPTSSPPSCPHRLLEGAWRLSTASSHTHQVFHPSLWSRPNQPPLQQIVGRTWGPRAIPRDPALLPPPSLPRSPLPGGEPGPSPPACFLPPLGRGRGQSCWLSDKLTPSSAHQVPLQEGAWCSPQTRSCLSLPSHLSSFTGCRALSRRVFPMSVMTWELGRATAITSMSP